MTINEYLDLALSDFREEMLKDNSLKDYYKALPKDFSPKAHLIDTLHNILLEEEKTDRWKELGEKAPTRYVVVNMITDRTLIKPLYKEAWSKALNVSVDKLS